MVIDLWIPVLILVWQFFRFATRIHMCMRIITMSYSSHMPFAGSCAWPALCGDQLPEIYIHSTREDN